MRGKNRSSANPLQPPARTLFGPLLLSLRSTATITAVFLVSLVFVLGLVTLLSYLKFESYANEVVERRIGIVTDRVRTSIETALRLGLHLEDIGIAPTVLKNTQASDPRIEAVSIFTTDDGDTLFSSDPGAIGRDVHPDWVAAQRRSASGAWRFQSRARVIIGRRLDSALEHGVGGVALVYSLADLNAREDAMLNDLVAGALVTLAVFSVIAVFGALLVTRDFRRTLRGLSEAIGSTETAEASAAMLPESLRSSVDRFRQAASEARGHLDQFEEALPKQASGDRAKTTRPAGAIG